MPGWTVHKNEFRTDAVHRVATEELGEAVVIDEYLGTYEHFCETADIDGVDSKHYLATGYRCQFERHDPEIVGDDQHSAFQVFRPLFENLHPHVERYLDDC